MRAFISWSGGKDCMFALHTFLKTPGNEAAYLVNFCEPESNKSRSHGLDKSLISAQAEAIQIPLIQEPISSGSYEFHLKKIIAQVKEQGVQYGVFGDIYLDAHRDWIERVCAEAEITPLFPIWGRDTRDILHDFIQEGFKAILVSVLKQERFKTMLGNMLDNELVATMREMEGVDPCGENGEYHTYVFDGPLFKHPVAFETGEEYADDRHYFLPIHL